MVRRLFLFGILVVGVLSGLVQNGTLAYLTAQSIDNSPRVRYIAAIGR